MKKQMFQNNHRTICALCNSNNTLFFYSELNLTLKKCNNCGLVFVHPLPLAEEYVKNLEVKYDVLADKYRRGLKELLTDVRFIKQREKSKWDEKKALIYKRDLRAIKKYLPNKKNLTFLDVGCGEGYFIREVIKNGFLCEGLEPSKTHSPSSELKSRVFNCFLKDFKTNKKYDVVTLLDVLEHTRKPVIELKNIRRIIKPNGLLMVRVPNLRWLIFKENMFNFFNKLTHLNIFDFNSQGLYAPHTHLHNFSKRSLRMLLEKCGFKVVGIEIINASHSDNTFKEIFYKAYYFIVGMLFQITGVNLAISLNVFAKCRDNR